MLKVDALTKGERVIRIQAPKGVGYYSSRKTVRVVIAHMMVPTKKVKKKRKTKKKMVPKEKVHRLDEDGLTEEKHWNGFY